jgi:hypothetical protein
MHCQMIMLAPKPWGVYDSQKKQQINNWRRKKNTIDYNKLWNNTNVKLNSGWSWTLKLIIDKIEWTNV